MLYFTHVKDLFFLDGEGRLAVLQTPRVLPPHQALPPPHQNPQLPSQRTATNEALEDHRKHLLSRRGQTCWCPILGDMFAAMMARVFAGGLGDRGLTATENIEWSVRDGHSGNKRAQAQGHSAVRFCASMMNGLALGRYRCAYGMVHKTQPITRLCAAHLVL